MRIFFDELFLGFDLNNFFIALAVITIVYLAWQSTDAHEERLIPTAVLIIENNRRRHRNLGQPNRNQSQNQPGADGGSPSAAETPSPTEPEPNVTLAQAQAVMEEVYQLAQENTEGPHHSLETLERELNEILGQGDSEPQRIIRDMDSSTDTVEGLRRRRLAFYTQEGGTAANEEGSVGRAGGDTDNTAHAENCSNENNENESKSENVKTDEPLEVTEAGADASEKEEFRIKLKYLNDDTRMVTGSPSEFIGDFKKRNFTVELAAQKLVRLVFNGHVLQPDSKTLQACGLFDNCVVHCLVHNKKPQTGSGSPNENAPQPEQANNLTGTNGLNIGGIGASANQENQFDDRNGTLLVYCVIAAVAFIIMFFWFCRFQYSYLFSLYATIGLILMTALFIIMLPLIFMVERE